MMIWQNVRDLATLSHKIMQKTLWHMQPFPKPKCIGTGLGTAPHNPFTLHSQPQNQYSWCHIYEHSALSTTKIMTSAVKCTDTIIIVVITHNFLVFVCMWLPSTFHSLLLLTQHIYETDTKHHYLCLIRR